MELTPNQIVDNRYQIIEKIGQGGMGTVWKALDQQLDDEVVIKMPLVNSEPALLQRFATEARTMRKHSSINPNIIDIQGVGTVDGTPFYVMRFLPGGSLEDRCPLVDSADSREFKIETYEWLLSISKALDYLHANGVMHRDVKPANILFNISGDAYLADFGIAKNPTEVSNFTQHVTATGTSPGTFGYMAPEVLYPEPENPITGASDQYALAVTLHESIAGKRPYDSTNMIKLYQQTQEGCPPLRASFPHLPEAASQAVVLALSADPSLRFVNCRAFAETFLDGLRNRKRDVNAPPVVSESKFDADGTRELDRGRFREELKELKKSDGGADGLFSEPSSSAGQPSEAATGIASHLGVSGSDSIIGGQSVVGVKKDQDAISNERSFFPKIQQDSTTNDLAELLNHHQWWMVGFFFVVLMTNTVGAIALLNPSGSEEGLLLLNCVFAGMLFSQTCLVATWHSATTLATKTSFAVVTLFLLSAPFMVWQVPSELTGDVDLTGAPAFALSWIVAFTTAVIGFALAKCLSLGWQAYFQPSQIANTDSVKFSLYRVGVPLLLFFATVFLIPTTFPFAAILFWIALSLLSPRAKNLRTASTLVIVSIASIFIFAKIGTDMSVPRADFEVVLIRYACGTLSMLLFFVFGIMFMRIIGYRIRYMD